MKIQTIFKLTKNDRLHCDAKLACHRLKLPSPSAMPNLLPCCEKRHRVTFANVPGGRGVQTTCWCPHSHIWTEPSWPPVKYSGINGCAHIRFMLSTLCFNTFDVKKMQRLIRNSKRISECENQCNSYSRLLHFGNNWKNDDIKKCGNACLRIVENYRKLNETIVLLLK